MRARKRSRADISTLTICGCRRSSCVVEPSKRVMLRPSSLASRSSGELAIRSISLPLSASVSVNALPSVTAVSAS